MSEQSGEGVTNISEVWYNLDQNSIEILNDGLKQDGLSGLESAGEGYLLPLKDEKRISQVLEAVKLSMGTMVAERVTSGQDSNSMVGIQGVTLDKYFLLGFSKPRAATRDQYIRDRNQVLAGANKTLEIFDKPKLLPVKPR